MSAQSRPEEALSLELAWEVEPICDRFEVAWRGDTPPRVEDYLAQAPESIHSTLLRELIQLEIYYRQARGERCRPAEYRERFPALAQDWLASALAEPMQTASGGDTGGQSDAGTALVSDCPGGRIGPYKLLQKLGEGGMGTVFVAEQEHPVKRPVALKLVKAGMDSENVIARFEQERQALALMDHPNIAKVLDAGTTANGRPYFVMELVKGIPITKFCDHEQLTLKERLELFIPVCNAVQHAHQKGIIHRDLKPSHVIIARYDGKPVPKVIDFGLAKATSPRFVEQTAFTEVGQLVGTLEYMAPEQAELNNLDVDTRADIYALGVILYELLTGSRPFTGTELRGVAFTDMLRMIRDVDPKNPSTRLASSEQRAAIAAQRKLEPAKLTKLLSGELDWIVMKALEKDRSRRYETANGLAVDIQRYLHNEPVAACPPSAWYRFRKLARRNRAAFTMAAVVTVALTVIACGSLVSALVLHDALRESEADRARAERAQMEATDRLYGSLVVQARGSALSRRVGQRFKSLEAVTEAVRIARDRSMSDEKLLELRNVAIGALALPDLRVAQEWDFSPAYPPSLAFVPKLDRYADVDRAGNISVRRVSDDKEIHRLRAWSGESWPMFSEDGQFLAIRGQSRLKLWRIARQGPVPILEEPDCVAAAFGPDNRLIAIGHRDSSIGLYDIASGKLLRQLTGGRPLSWLVFHPQGRQLAVRTRSSVQVRDVATGKVLVEFPMAQKYGCPFVTWHPEGKIVAAVGDEGRIYLWNVLTRKQIGKLEGCKSGGIEFAFNHAGDLLASKGWEGMLRLWDWRTGRQIFATQAAFCSDVRFSPDDRLLASTHASGKQRIWEVNPGREYRTLVRDPAPDPDRLERFSIHPQGRLLAGALGNNGLGLWDLRTGNLAAHVPMGNITSAWFEPSGALQTFGLSGLWRWPSTIDPRAIDARAPAIVRLGPAQELPLTAKSFGMAQSRNGRIVAAAQGWGALVLHRDHPDPLVKLVPHEDVRNVAVSSDGQWVVTGGFGNPGGAKVWHARSGKLVQDLPVGSFGNAAFSPDGKWLATTGGNHVQLWSVGSWTAGKPVAGPGWWSLAFSPDSKILAVEAGHGAIRLIDPHTGRDYAQLEDPNHDRALYIAFTPDGTQLVMASQDSNSFHVWNLAALRRQLDDMGLDWDLPAYPAPKGRFSDESFQVEVN